GGISGISYRADRGPWISGSKVKSTRFTWRKLIEKEKISYLPRRDDAILYGMFDNFDLSISIELYENEAEEFEYIKKHYRFKIATLEERWARFVDFRGMKRNEIAILKMLMALSRLLDALFTSRKL